MRSGQVCSLVLLLLLLQSWCTMSELQGGCDIVLLMKCVNFAAIKHKTQRRKDPEKTPYINHPIGVATILTEHNISDPIVIQAALLHDTVEDTDTSFEELEKEFGKEVTEVVRQVTDDKSLPKEKRKLLQIEHAAEHSHEARLVKLADKLYNVRDLQRATPTGWSEQRVQEYFLWAEKVVNQMKGTHPGIEAQLDEVFAQAKRSKAEL